MNFQDLAREFERRIRADQRKDQAVAEAEQAIDAMTALPVALSQPISNIAAHLADDR